MNLLRSELTTLIQSSHSRTSELYYCLDELLLGNKHYYSIIKRSSDIQDIFATTSAMLSDILARNKDLIKQAENEETKRSLYYINNNNASYANLNVVIGWCGSLEDAFVNALKKAVEQESAFDIKYIHKTRIKLGVPNTVLPELDEEKAFGSPDEASLYNNMGKCKPFSASSYYSRILEIEKNHFPYAYAYITFIRDFKGDKQKIIDDMKTTIAKCFKEEIEQIITKKIKA